MCGITGYKSFSRRELMLQNSLENAVVKLNRRGPDFQAWKIMGSVGLGHARLSIIDPSSNANQPMSDASGRYSLVFNGEIYNYRELKTELNQQLFQSSSDTEVLLYLLIEQGEVCLQKLNGFFSFAFYDNEKDSLLLARDRMGIKPLHYFQSKDFFAFGSEMKALLCFPFDRVIDQNSLYWYLRLTYLPMELSMIMGVRKLLPGHYLKVHQNNVSDHTYWSLEEKNKSFIGSYEEGQKTLIGLIEQSVEKRMVADVPLGAFLSGGTDSSIVTAMATRFNPQLHTYSIGYKDHSFFDETHFAELVAKKFKTQHTTFSLTNNDLLNEVENLLDYIDEPFADSSAIPTYILSKKVSASMKVALSGDGADELFGGYYKHLAFTKVQENSGVNVLLKRLHPAMKYLPQSRSTAMGNLTRRLTKYASLAKMSTVDQYWTLASFNQNANALLLSPVSSQIINEFQHKTGDEPIGLNDFLDLDLKMVLPGDMLTKVDLMSMANGLEVRVPFLDKDIVKFARSLPSDFKVSGNKRKMILQDAFEHILPRELHHRPKKGFEVPLLSWLRNELASEIDEHVFNSTFLMDQKLFHVDSIMNLKKVLHASNAGDVPSAIWSLYVFQKWYKRYFQ